MNYRIKKFTAFLTLFVFMILMGVNPVFSENGADSTAIVRVTRNGSAV